MNSITVPTDLRFNYRQYFKPNPVAYDPYIDERYKLHNIDTSSRLDELATKTKKVETEWHKIFDDATLEFDVNRLQFMQHTKLDLSNSQVTENGILQLAMSEFACNVQEIDLSRNSFNIQDVALRYIADSPQLNKLETLFLNDCSNISDYGIMYLFQPFTQPTELASHIGIKSQRRTQIKKVAQPSAIGSGGFTKQEFYSTGLTSFSDSQTDFSRGRLPDRLLSFSMLSLQGNPQLTDKCMECICYSANIRLHYLDLSFTRVSHKGLKDYLISPSCAELQYLDISNQPITDETIQILCESEYCTKLLALKINSCPITKSSLEYLSDTINTINLEELDVGTTLKNSYMTDEGLIRLGRAKYMGKLRELKLQGQPFSEFRLIQFIKSSTMKSIEFLHIGNNPDITDTIIESLLKDNLNIKRINISKTAITAKGVELLQKTMDVTHSIVNMPSVIKLIQQGKAGVRVQLCDKCSISSDADSINPSLCFICRDRQITSIEYPAKLCNLCGHDYQVTPKCYGCSSYKNVKTYLYRCYACSIGMNKYKCVNCLQVC